mmetsp:Transcript_8862/g.12618  ORF Transcript_8862/g.12618 Transcript_8862/m.12618 type:complete len:92 (+) Transcript_8862:169-444(+)
MSNDKNLNRAEHEKISTFTLQHDPERSNRRRKTPWWNRNWKLHHGFGNTYDKHLCIGGQQVLIEESMPSSSSKASQSKSDITDRAYMSACW